MPVTSAPAAKPPATPRRLLWHHLIFGLWYRPVDVLDEARDRSVWGAAMFLSLLCGALGTLGKDSFWVQWGVSPVLALEAMAIASGVTLLATLFLGAVTHAIARRLGGNGRFAPTTGLFAVVFWATDLPRLFLNTWLPADSVPVQAAASVTAAFGCVIATLLIRGQHHLPTHKAVASVAIQMVAAVALLKFPPGSG